MKVLIIGSGGREHALAWKIAQSRRADSVFIAPGNPGTALHGENIAIPAVDIEGLKNFALGEKIDLTVVGPELPLTLGLTDSFEKAGLKVFGPSMKAAELEGSKVFSKELMQRYKIPTAFFKKFDDQGKAKAYINTHNPPFVVKADGLAAGKGVFICKDRDEAREALDTIMARMAFGVAGKRVVIEEFLKGQEVSYMAVTDGKTIVPLASAQDHKAIFDNDQGPNTGGMGAYSPSPIVTPELEKEIINSIMIPTVRAMEDEGRPYKGVLYAGLMIVEGKPKVLEFNCRFGDPETQPVLMRLDSDLLELLMSAVVGGLEGVRVRWKAHPSVCVVMASSGYPGDYKTGAEIKGLANAAAHKDVMVFHAGTSMKEGRVVTSGGRVLGVTALGKDIKAAIGNAYGAVKEISWDGAYFRTDIGKKALGY